MSSSRRNAWLRAIAVLLLLLGVGLLVTIWFATRDEPPPEVSDLVGHRRDVAPAANGFLLLDLEGAEVYWPGADDEDVESEDVELALLPGEDAPFDRELAERVLQRNAGILKRLEAALAAPDFQLPETLRFEDISNERLLNARGLAYVLQCRVRMFLESGQPLSSLDAALRTIEFGLRFTEGQGTVLDYLVGLAISELGAKGLIAVVSTAEIDTVALAKYADRLHGNEVRADALADVIRAEFTFACNILGDGEREEMNQVDLGPLAGSFLLVNQTKRWFAEEYRHIIHEIDKPPAERTDSDIVEKYGLDSAFAWVRNLPGKMLIGMLLPNMSNVAMQRDRFMVLLAAGQTVMALRAHHLDHGELPSKLDDLVPHYLREVPLDPFDGKPLRYDREKKILYSVGDDLEDSGGSEDDDPQEDANEPTFRLEF